MNVWPSWTVRCGHAHTKRFTDRNPAIAWPWPLSMGDDALHTCCVPHTHRTTHSQIVTRLAKIAGTHAPTTSDYATACKVMSKDG